MTSRSLVLRGALAYKHGMRYVIVRTFSCGVFYGQLSSESTETQKVLINARRIWRWEGAATLSQLAMEGTKLPEKCKFPMAVKRIELTSPNGFEVLDMTDEAVQSLDQVPVWKA